MTLVKTLLVLGLTLTAVGASADNVCQDEVYRVQKVAGYNISSSEKEILRADRASSFVKKASKATIVNRILIQIQERANRGHSSKNSISDESLANEIYLAARAWGLDPLIFTKMIEQESQFHTAAYNPSAHDSGIAQTTYWAYAEMRAQYKKRDVGAILFELSDKYFNAMSPHDWVAWITRSSVTGKNFKNTATPELRNNVAYGLASGASLLKIYLAEAGGDYRTALKMYNGAWAYADEVLAREANLRCGEAGAAADQILLEASEMLDGSSSKEYLEELVAPQGIEI